MEQEWYCLSQLSDHARTLSAGGRHEFFTEVLWLCGRHHVTVLVVNILDSSYESRVQLLSSCVQGGEALAYRVTSVPNEPGQYSLKLQVLGG